MAMVDRPWSRVADRFAIVIVGGLVASLLLSAWWRAHVCILRSSEATMVLQNIRGSEAAYEAEHDHYAGCTSAGLSTSSDELADAAYHPRALAELDGQRVAFDGREGDLAGCMNDLRIRADGPVFFTYAIVASNDGAAYEAIAVGDPDDDERFVEWRASSRSLAIEQIGGDP